MREDKAKSTASAGVLHPQGTIKPGKPGSSGLHLSPYRGLYTYNGLYFPLSFPYRLS